MLEKDILENDMRLKPCPFCGGEAAFIADTRTIKCKSCGGAFICTNPMITTLEAAEAWNNRPGEAAMKEKYKRMLESAEILDAALREYQQKYGE